MMRLLLCSYRLAGHSKMLRSLARGRRAAVIPNAGDQWPERPEHRDREVTDLVEAGFDVTLLDLRGYFGQSDALRRELAALDAVWVPGGNTICARPRYERQRVPRSRRRPDPRWWPPLRRLQRRRLRDRS